MKRHLINLVFKIYYTILRTLKRKSCILFESAPDYSDNTLSVFLEMVRRGIDTKYDLVWIRADNKVIPNNMKQYSSVSIASINDSTASIANINDWNKYLFYRSCSKCIICCNRFVLKRNQKSTLFYLGHGTPLKSLSGRYEAPADIDFFLVPSEYTIPIFAREFNFDASKIFALGYPRNDELLSKKVDLNRFFNTSARRIIVWYPTFRQHKNDSKEVKGSSLPLIHDKNVAIELNEFAKLKNILIVLKPHFAQDTSYIKQLELSNIRFINDEFFKEHHISSYQFVGSCDALITDYSSIMFDFLLLNRPIALIWEDVDEYRKYPGLIPDTEKQLNFVTMINSLQELKSFLSDLCLGQDKFLSQRKTACNLFNYSLDSDNTSRVVDFIVKKAEL